jgi:DNA-binding NtrC family response regulator
MLLIVDDDPNFLEQAMQVLNSGRGVFIARDAQQAKELMGSVGAAFSLVLIDLDMPGQDGFSLIREMRAAFPDLPVIAMSGVCQRDVLESAKVIGAADALPKPIDRTWELAIARAQSMS